MTPVDLNFFCSSFTLQLWESDAFTKSTGILLASANGHTEVVKVLLKEAGEAKKKTVANQGRP